MNIEVKENLFINNFFSNDPFEVTISLNFIPDEVIVKYFNIVIDPGSAVIDLSMNLVSSLVDGKKLLQVPISDGTNIINSGFCTPNMAFSLRKNVNTIHNFVFLKYDGSQLDNTTGGILNMALEFIKYKQ